MFIIGKFNCCSTLLIDLLKKFVATGFILFYSS